MVRFEATGGFAAWVLTRAITHEEGAELALCDHTMRAADVKR